jgi:hypothetical protein
MNVKKDGGGLNDGDGDEHDQIYNLSAVFRLRGN